MNRMKQLLKNFGIIFLVLFVLAALMSTAQFGSEQPEEVGVNRVVTEIQSGNVASVNVVGNTVEVTLKDGEGPGLETQKEAGQTFAELVEPYGVTPEQLLAIETTNTQDNGAGFWIRTLLPYIFPFIILGVIIYFMTRQVSGANNKAMGFGQSKAREAKPDDNNKTTFADVAGANEAKEELEEIVDFLKRPKKYADMGAKIPKGVLLMGSPGTGKTLLAKAVAGQAGVPFFHISGSEFVEMFVGVGASRVRDLFTKAKKAAPAIVFIDEIDAVGRKRGAGLGGSHDEREQTLNQILVEMDGFDPTLGVIVIGATNRPDVLDKALLRPGRFDRQVVIDLPDIKDREAILKVHAKNKPIDTDKVSLRKVAERTPGFSGADLANLLNEAAILAVREDKKAITEDMIFESIDKVIIGPAKKSRVMTEHDREMTAYHEAGHAVVGYFLKHADTVRKVSIIGRGRAGGYTLSMPEDDVRYTTIAKMKDQMAMIMGGYVTEKMIYGDDMLSTGPSSDLKKVTELATKMVKLYGMSDKLGPRQFGDNEEMIFLAQEIHDKKNYSEKTAEEIDAEIDRLIREAHDRAMEIVKTKRDKMDALVKRLLEIETVEQGEFEHLMK